MGWGGGVGSPSMRPGAAHGWATRDLVQGLSGGFWGEGVGEGEVAEGFEDVQADLGAEEVGGVETALGAEAVEEG
jgi:hypothetical protein